MEEAQKPEQKPNYIELSQDPQNVGNIFNELSGELGDLDFSEKNVKKEVVKKDPIETAYFIMSKLFILGVIASVIMTIDVFVRSSEDNTLFVSLPICSYLAMSVDGYNNNDCKTLPMILAEKTAEQEKMEKNIAVNLVLLVPRFLQSLDITNSPKVQFIQEHTGDSKISIIDTINRFTEIKNKTNYQWEDIECKNMRADEKGNFSVSCQAYGGALLTPGGFATKTSREVALDFLARLSEAKSGFQILSYPKSLDISEFNSADGFKAVFSTKTSLELKLQYLPANKM